MCGIAGTIQPEQSQESLLKSLDLMLKTIKHRGPDDGGQWLCKKNGVALGHQRLSILDLSAAGHQPMHSACGRFVIVFNGEIYNHLALRKILEKNNQQPIDGWRGHSDTETFLATCSAWGMTKALQATVGMFAFAIWDMETNSLTLARDRLGEKPLYYGWQGGTFLFGSELKALKAHPAFVGKSNLHAISTFLRLNYIPTPFTLYEDIHKLEAGTSLTLESNHIRNRHLPKPVSYWSLADSALAGQEHPFCGDFTEAVDALEQMICEAVQLQSIADVNVGAFLSGGIDSSTIVAMMQKASSSEVTTFSIGMPNAKMNEAHHAALVAKHLGTRHIEHVIQAKEALDIIPLLPKIWDEPFADSSQIPTYLVSKLARQQVTVALSGDGGDEFFLGYPVYVFYNRLWHLQKLGKLPLTAALDKISFLGKNHHAQNVIRKAKNVAHALKQPNTQMLGRYWMDRYRQEAVPIWEQQGVEMRDLPLLNDAAGSTALWDAGTYLPDDILTKIDRAAMIHGLETRAPLLDHRIIEFSFRLPIHYKLNQHENKRILREVLYRHVPKEIVDRPKMGFSIPLSEWLKDELRPWAESLIKSPCLNTEIFNKKQLYDIWDEHISNKQDNTEKLWGILTLLQFEL